MPERVSFRSLRFRLLGPILLAACVAALLVALASSWLGTRWARSELRKRFDGVEQTLAGSTFPLNPLVLDLLAELTQTQLVTFDEAGRSLHSTVSLDLLGSVSFDDPDLESRDGENTVLIGNTEFVALTFDTERASARSDGVYRVAVLFDQQQIDTSRRRAALLPLAAGLSTIFALTSITLFLSTRLVARITRLKQRVDAVAEGDFHSNVSDKVADEVGLLGEAVDAMGSQLDKLWKRVNRQHGEKLLHQVASGLAHQLRNSLTGARMAVELHAAECGQADDEGLRVAIHQIELSEDHVHRLLLAASGRQNDDRPRRLVDCWQDVKTTLAPLARHLRIDVQWNCEAADDDRDDRLADRTVKDGATWVAAATNLIHNAMEAGDVVQVDLTLLEYDRVRLRVSDNGPGMAESVADELFEPFVTSKPEGMGLGLPVVRRAADYLGGNVTWRREQQRTVFELTIP